VQVVAQPDRCAHRRGRQIESEHPSDREVRVRASSRKHDACAEHVHEQGSEQNGLDRHVRELKRLTRDVHQVANGEHDDVIEVAEQSTRSGEGNEGRDRSDDGGHERASSGSSWNLSIPTFPPLVSSSVCRPVSAKNTSSREGWWSATSSTVIPALSRARTTVVANPSPLRTGALSRRPSWLAWTTPAT